ncbi:MAG: outer membrane beta-barrel family protein [Bacteroidota bacterium]
MKYLCLLLFFTYALSCLGQVDPYIGKIIDAQSGAPIAYATVAFYDDTTLVGGTLTGNNGIFSYTCRTLPTHAEISFMGYQNRRIPITNWQQNPSLLIQLESSSKKLEEVVVMGESTQIQRKVDKKVIKLGKDIQLSGANALAAFDYLPEVELDLALGTIALRGSENVRVLVNGQLSPLLATELLLQIPAHTIQSIEIITTPSVKYRSEGLVGVINIILKKDKQNGFNLQSNANYDTGRYGLGINGNYHSSKLNLRWQAAATELSILDLQDIRRYFTDGYTERITTSHEMDGTIRNLSLGTDFFFHPKHTFSIDLKYTDDQHSYYKLSQFSELQNQEGFSYLRENTHQHYIFIWNSNYRWSIAPDHFLEIDYNLNSSPNDYPLRDSREDLLLFDQLLTEDFQIGALALDYSWPITEAVLLETGLARNTQNLQSSRDHQPSDGPRTFSIFDYKEVLLSGYGQISFPFKSLSVQAGLRYEYFDAEAVSLSNNFATQQTFSNLFPSLHLGYSYNDKIQIYLSYNKRVSRPNFHQINAFQIVSPFYIWEYNPNIKPEFNDNLELFFQRTGERISFNTSLSFRRRRDAILWQESAQNQQQIFRYINAGHFQSYGLEMSLTHRLQQLWIARLSANYYYTSTNQKDLVTYNHTYSGAVSFRNTLQLSKHLSTDLSYLFWPQRQASFNRLQARQRLDWAIGAKLFKSKLSMHFRIVDLFNTYLIDRTSVTPNLEQETIWEIQNQRRNFQYSVSYQITAHEGSNRKRKSRKYNEIPID